MTFSRFTIPNRWGGLWPVITIAADIEWDICKRHFEHTVWTFLADSITNWKLPNPPQNEPSSTNIAVSTLKGRLVKNVCHDTKQRWADYTSLSSTIIYDVQVWRSVPTRYVPFRQKDFIHLNMLQLLIFEIISNVILVASNLLSFSLIPISAWATSSKPWFNSE